MTEQEYYSIKDRLSPSMIGTILTGCPADVQRKLIYGTPETPAMARGTIGHACTLEPERVKETFVLFDRTQLEGSGTVAKKAKYTKDGSPDQNTRNLERILRFKEQTISEGKFPVIDPEEFDNIQRVAGILFNHPTWKKINDESVLIEHPMLWQADNGCLMRGKSDHINPNRGVITDIKFTFDISPDAIIRAIHDRMYHAQVAAYMDGFKKTNNGHAEITEGALIAINLKTLDVVPYGLSQTFQEQTENWDTYHREFSRDARPNYRDISIKSGRELYERACQRWLDWNNEFGNCWEVHTVEFEDSKDNIVSPKNQWPGWDYLSKFQTTAKIRLVKL